MKNFRYIAPRTAESAVELVRGGGRFLGGGTDLLAEMKEGIAAPPTLVSVKSLPGMTELRRASGTWSIGAAVTLARLAAEPGLRAECGALVEAAEEVGSPQIRNVATVGGNLAQHSRCWYYRHRDIRCLKRGGGVCYAREGECKFHSLFTGCACLSPVVSNLAVACAALNARIVVLRAGGRQESLSVAELFASAWRMPAAHHSLRSDDLILRIEVAPVPGQRSAYLQIAEKADFDWALVSCAVAARIEGGKMRDPRVVLGALAPIPWQSELANRSLEGKPLTAESAVDAVHLLLREARPFPDNAYKIPIARALIRRAVLKMGG